MSSIGVAFLWCHMTQTFGQVMLRHGSRSLGYCCILVVSTNKSRMTDTKFTVSCRVHASLNMCSSPNLMYQKFLFRKDHRSVLSWDQSANIFWFTERLCLKGNFTKSVNVLTLCQWWYWPFMVQNSFFAVIFTLTLTLLNVNKDLMACSHAQKRVRVKGSLPGDFPGLICGYNYTMQKVHTKVGGGGADPLLYPFLGQGPVPGTGIRVCK